MCVIFGGIGKPQPSILKALAEANVSRGADGWGIFGDNKGIKKGIGPIPSKSRMFGKQRRTLEK